MVTCTFSNVWIQRQADLCVFKISVVYIGSSRLARAVQCNTVSIK